MKRWVVVVDSPWAAGCCAVERVDLALGLLAMDHPVAVLLHADALLWLGQQPQDIGLRSAMKRLGQVPLYGGEVWVAGESATAATLPAGFDRVAPDHLGERLRSAAQVL